MTKKAGRNDPCPCGSGKKYKNCCLGKEEAKKLYTSSGKRKFRAKILEAQDKAQQVFQGVPTGSSDLAKRIKPLDPLRFRMSQADFRTQGGEQKGPFQLPKSTASPTQQAPEHKPGEEFIPADEDFRKKSESKDCEEND